MIANSILAKPLHQTSHASSEYEAFLAGFVLSEGNVWTVR
jgi:hypothetical protein